MNLKEGGGQAERKSDSVFVYSLFGSPHNGLLRVNVDTNCKLQTE